MCELTGKCWRYCYSRYYKEIDQYSIPPTREVLFFAMYVPISIYPKGGMFCENMPSYAERKNLCPWLEKMKWDNCFERQKEIARIERLTHKEKTVRFPGKEERAKIPGSTRRMIAKRYNYQCVYCGRFQNAIDSDGKKVQTVVDHFVPLALGGDALNVENLVLACRKCNKDKGVSLWKLGCRK